MTSIICAFISGFLLAAVIFWIITRQLQKDWQAEYRRLMGGIKEALSALANSENTVTARIIYTNKILANTYTGVTLTRK